jgi:hypothetical protein
MNRLKLGGPSRRALLSRQMSDATEAKDLTCFVIGPIGEKDADAGSAARKAYEEAIEVLEEVIEPACRGFGISVIRADRISTPGEIPEQIFRHLRDAHVVIADLTGANPNVMYELGLRHTSGKLTIQIGERDRLPFDVNVIRTILFKRSEGGLVEARRKLSAAIAAGLETGGNPVTATRVWFEQRATSNAENDGVGDSEQPEELGFLEQMAEMSEAMDSASATLESITTIFNEIGRLAEAGASELTAINASGGPASARVAVANRVATALDDPATKLAVLAGDYSNSVARMDPGITYALRTSQESDADVFREKVRETVQTSEGSLAAVERLRNEALAAGEATRALRKVNRRIANSLNQILGTRVIFEKWKELLPPV